MGALLSAIEEGLEKPLPAEAAASAVEVRSWRVILLLDDSPAD